MSLAHSQAVDVILPVRSARGREGNSLALCCRVLRRNIPVHHLIIISSDVSKQSIDNVTSLADVAIIEKAAEGVGRARSIGLTHVDTEYFASIDDDVLVSKDWYAWCIDKIRQPGVAACQGWAKPTAAVFGKWVQPPNRNKYATLGDTMLCTRTVRDVGIPDEPKDEDILLRRRLNEKGFIWEVNPNLISLHLQSDIDILRHCYLWGRYEAHDLLYLARHVLWHARSSALAYKDQGLERALFTFLEQIALATGAFVGYYSKNYREIQSSAVTLFSRREIELP